MRTAKTAPIAAVSLLALGGCDVLSGTIGDESELPADIEVAVQNQTTDCSQYPEKRYFLEAQGWWVPIPGLEDAVNDFGHLHVGTCFPVEQQVSGTLDFDVRVTLHDNPGELRAIRPHFATPGGNPTSGKISNIGNTCPAGETCTWWFHTQMDTTLSDYDGRQEIRFLTSVAEPDGQELHVSTGWQVDIRNGGGREVKDYRRANFLEARGWYEGVNYEVGRLASEFPFDPKTEWALKLEIKPGADGIATTGYQVTIDPRFHVGDPGRVLIDGDGEYRGTIDLPVAELEPGPHKLVLRNFADCRNGACGSVNDGQRLVSMFLIPFTVAGDTTPSQPAPTDPAPAPTDPAPAPTDPAPAPTDPAPAGGTTVLPVSADTFVRGGSYSMENYGTSNTLSVKDGADNYDRETYIRFDIAGLSAANVTLRLDVRRLSNGAPVPMEVCLAAESFGWIETMLTFADRFTQCTPIAGTLVAATGTLDIDLGRSLAELGTNQVTLILRDTTRENKMIDIASRETGVGPQLILQ